uniref:Secreted protein n=1 Tax=Panstrongylus lignarius TaxID=156445 RepID=A0A224XUR7_9HEMI
MNSSSAALFSFLSTPVLAFSPCAASCLFSSSLLSLFSFFIILLDTFSIFISLLSPFNSLFTTSLSSILSPNRSFADILTGLGFNDCPLVNLSDDLFRS